MGKNDRRQTQEALHWLAHQPVQVMMTDLGMPVMDGYRLIEYLSAWSQRPAVIIYSGEANRSEQMTRYLEQGAIAVVLTKPANMDDLLTTVRRVALQATALPSSLALAR